MDASGDGSFLHAHYAGRTSVSVLRRGDRYNRSSNIEYR